MDFKYFRLDEKDFNEDLIGEMTDFISKKMKKITNESNRNSKIKQLMSIYLFLSIDIGIKFSQYVLKNISKASVFCKLLIILENKREQLINDLSIETKKINTDEMSLYIVLNEYEKTYNKYYINYFDSIEKTFLENQLKKKEHLINDFDENKKKMLLNIHQLLIKDINNLKIVKKLAFNFIPTDLKLFDENQPFLLKELRELGKNIENENTAEWECNLIYTENNLKQEYYLFDNSNVIFKFSLCDDLIKDINDMEIELNESEKKIIITSKTDSLKFKYKEHNCSIIKIIYETVIEGHNIILCEDVFDENKVYYYIPEFKLFIYI